MTHLRRLIAGTLAILTAACMPVGDSDGNGSLGGAVGAIAVVEGTVEGVEDDRVDVVLVENPVFLADLQRPGFGASTQRLRELIDDRSTTGSPLRLRFSEGRYPVGARYAFFIGWFTAEEFSSLYAHDLPSDRPAPPFDRQESANGNTPDEVLECLIASFGTEGGRRGLDALIEVNLEKNALEQQPAADVTTFHRCASD